jgi:protein gp37
MADRSSIEWTDATWNPITGCSIATAGCARCYAMVLAGTRLKHHPSRAGLTRETKAGPVWTGEVRFNEAWLEQPLRWTRPRKIFVCAHGDLFAPGVPVTWIDRVFAVMRQAHRHSFQVLTKRPDTMLDYVRGVWASKKENGAPRPNVILGASVERQREADLRRPAMAELAAAGWPTWCSYEPALGPVDWRGWEFLRCLVSGGESGKDARPNHPDWHRGARDFCAAHAIAYQFKQWGGWRPISEGQAEWWDALYEPRVVAKEHQDQGALDDIHGRSCKVAQRVVHRDGSTHAIADPGAWQQGSGAMLAFEVGKRLAGRFLDGVEHNAMPEARP